MVLRERGQAHDQRRIGGNDISRVHALLPRQAGAARRVVLDDDETTAFALGDELVRLDSALPVGENRTAGRSSRSWSSPEPSWNNREAVLRLWGKVVSGMMFFIAAIFLIVAAIVPEARWESFAVAVILTVVALFGVPGLVKVFSSFTGDEEILANGIAGPATIQSLKPTGWRYNRYYPIVRFNFSVEAGGAAYPVEIKQAVDPELLQRLAPGAVVGIRVDRQDHNRVVIDWREPIRGGTQPAQGASAENRGETALSTERREKNSLWPFLRWGFLVFGLIFVQLSCEEDTFEKGGVTAQAVVLQKTYTPGTESASGIRRTPSRRSVSYKFTTRNGRRSKADTTSCLKPGRDSRKASRSS